METDDNEQWEKTGCANAVMDSRCQEFNIQFYFSGFFYDLDLYYIRDGVCAVRKQLQGSTWDREVKDQDTNVG